MRGPVSFKTLKFTTARDTDGTVVGLFTVLAHIHSFHSSYGYSSTVAIVTVAIVTVAIVTVAIVTVAIVTVAIVTVAMHMALW